MFVSALLLMLGLALLIKGADWLVDGATVLAKKFKVSDLAIGLTIVAFGTSAPELVVNTIASYQGYQDIVFGNVIGSNNFNLFIILGIAGLITPLTVQSSTVWKEIPISFFAIVLLYILANGVAMGSPELLGRFDGIILLVCFILFLMYVRHQLKADAETSAETVPSTPPFKMWGFIIIGLAGLVGGGQLVVTHAVKIASAMGMSEKLIGLTIIAASTSLPELATTVVAALKKNIDIAVGNIIGSNIFNIFLILSASSIISPIAYDTAFNLELYILGGGTLFLFIAMFTGKKKTLDRWEAAILLISYLVYMTYLVAGEL